MDKVSGGQSHILPSKHRDEGADARIVTDAPEALKPLVGAGSEVHPYIWLCQIAALLYLDGGGVDQSRLRPYFRNQACCLNGANGAGCDQTVVVFGVNPASLTVAFRSAPWSQCAEMVGYGPGTVFGLSVAHQKQVFHVAAS